VIAMPDDGTATPLRSFERMAAGQPQDPLISGALIPIVAEALRIEEDCEHISRASLLAVAWGRRLHYLLGTAAAVLAGVAGALVLTNNHDRIAAATALTSAVCAALVTFLNPGERAAKRQAQSAAYRQLGNRTRVFRSIDLANMPHAEADARIRELVARRDDLDATHDPVTGWFSRRARRGIARGDFVHRVDDRISRTGEERAG
jgi:hypothetical protein